MKKEILCILCSLFCFGYCFLIYSIKSGTRFYLIWGMGGVCFLGLTAFLHFDLWSRMPDVLQKITIIMLTLGILLFVLSDVSFELSIRCDFSRSGSVPPKEM